MRFFTREWHAGALSDAEEEAAVAGYAAHLASIQEKLPQAMRDLGFSTDIHDALIQQVIFDRKAVSVALHLVCGDVQQGYKDVTLAYAGVEWNEDDLETLRTVANNPDAEALYQELDVLRDGFEHRLLFWPYVETRLRFRGLKLLVRSRADRRLQGDIARCVDL